MLKAWKSYVAFTRSRYRMVVFFVIPVICFLFTLGIMMREPTFIFLVLLTSSVGLMIAEPMSDYWFMGGFYGKSNSALEFLQSSNRFEEFMKHVVCVDFVRRICTHFGIYLGICGIGWCYDVGTGTTALDLAAGLEGNVYVLLSFLPFLAVLFAQLEVLIGRHFYPWNHHYIVVMLGFMLMTPITIGLINMDVTGILLVDGILAVLIVAVGIGTVVYTKKKVRDSYYDAGY